MIKQKFLLGAIVSLIGLSAVAQQENSSFDAYLFTREERDSLQFWFYDRATVMGLKDEKRDAFYNLVLYHSYRLKKLRKWESDLSQDELIRRFETIIQEQNEQIHLLLDEKQYKYYLDTYDKILDSVYSRKGWPRSKKL